MSEKVATFKNQAAQGDVLLRRIKKLPDDAKTMERQTEELVVAHSETQHHHSIFAPPSAVEMFGSSTPNLAYLRVNADFADLKHLRGWDTHQTLRIAKGTYEVRRQREEAPEGWRTVQD